MKYINRYMDTRSMQKGTDSLERGGQLSCFSDYNISYIVCAERRIRGSKRKNAARKDEGHGAAQREAHSGQTPLHIHNVRSASFNCSLHQMLIWLFMTSRPG